jgi:hypothetical protein
MLPLMIVNIGPRRPAVDAIIRSQVAHQPERMGPNKWDGLRPDAFQRDG